MGFFYFYGVVTEVGMSGRVLIFCDCQRVFFAVDDQGLGPPDTEDGEGLKIGIINFTYAVIAGDIADGIAIDFGINPEIGKRFADTENFAFAGGIAGRRVVKVGAERYGGIGIQVAVDRILTEAATAAQQETCGQQGQEDIAQVDHLHSP